MLAAVLTHVVLINFSYGVIVKIYSINLLLLAVFLVAPDLDRLADLLVFHRPTRPREVPPRWFDSGRVKIVRLGLKALFIGYFLFTMTRDRLEMKQGIEKIRARQRAAHKLDRFFLTDRGFHWINELPVDR